MIALTVCVTKPDVSCEYNLQAMLQGFVAQLLDNNVVDSGLQESPTKAYYQVLQPDQDIYTAEKLYEALFIDLQTLSNTGLKVILCLAELRQQRTSSSAFIRLSSPYQGLKVSSFLKSL